MKRLIPILLLLLFCVSILPSQTFAYETYNVKGYYNITWYGDNPDPGMTVVQKIVLTKNTTISKISIPVGLETKVVGDPHPDLIVGFGLMDKDDWPYVSDPITEVRVSSAGLVTLDIGKTLAAGTYAVYFTVAVEDLDWYCEQHLDGHDYYWWWKIPYTSNTINGNTVVHYRHVEYHWGFLGLGKFFTATVYDEDETNKDVALLIETDISNGFSPYFSTNGNINYLTIAGGIGIVVATYVVYRRSKT